MVEKGLKGGKKEGQKVKKAGRKGKRSGKSKVKKGKGKTNFFPFCYTYFPQNFFIFFKTYKFLLFKPS